VTVQAEDSNKIYYADKIPDYMLPLSEIEFVNKGYSSYGIYMGKA